MFKNILRIQVEEAFPVHVKGRPRLLGFDDAYEDILQVVRTGMQWRHLRPKRVSYITVFKTMHMWIDTPHCVVLQSRGQACISLLPPNGVLFQCLKRSLTRVRRKSAKTWLFIRSRLLLKIQEPLPRIVQHSDEKVAVAVASICISQWRKNTPFLVPQAHALFESAQTLRPNHCNVLCCQFQPHVCLRLAK